MRTLYQSFVISLAAFLLVSTGVVVSAATVQLELVGDARGAAMTFQEWGEALGKAGIPNVRLRASTDADQVGIKNEGTEQDPMYVVTGMVLSRNELQLPGGRYGRGDMAKLAQWLNDLRERGPVSKRPKLLAFGLTEDQLSQVMQALSAPVGVVAKGSTARQVVEKIVDRAKLPLSLDAETGQALDAVRIEDDLLGVSTGTALAYALQQGGYGLAPRADGNAVVFHVLAANSDTETWPVGRPSEKSPSETLPGLYEFHSVNIQNVSAAKTLEAIAKRLKAPVLFDRAALARHHIDPAKAMVSMPQTRTTYSLALRKLLFQAGMKFEVRCDDADSPFLWVTAVKPG